MINWVLEKRLIKDLKPHPKNPRKLSKHDAEHLQKSMEKFGIVDKACINTDNQIIGGHQRIQMLKRMGVKEIEVWVPDKPLEAKDVDELCVRLNRNVGEWDFDVLANEFEMNDLFDWGFSDEELSVSSVENIESEEPKKENKQKECPACGHLF